MFREHAALSAFENDGAREFDLGGLAAISDEDYDALEPVQWPVRAASRPIPTRLFADGGFSTPDRKARFIAPEPPALREATSAEYPLRLNTGRAARPVAQHDAHGQSPKLGAHKPEPFLEIHPLDAKAPRLANNGFARVRSRHGACTLKVVTSASQQRGSLFAPIHWSDANASSARVGDLVVAADRSVLRPARGQGDAGRRRAGRPSPIAALRWRASRSPCRKEPGGRASRCPARAGILFATNDAPMAWHDRAPDLFPQAVLTEYVDREHGLYRAAAFVDGRLEGALFVGPADAPPQWGDLRQMVGGAAHRRSPVP